MSSVSDALGLLSKHLVAYIDFDSKLRKGNVEALSMGEVPVIDPRKKSMLISRGLGSVTVSGRSVIDTFTVSKNFLVKDITLDTIEGVAKQFIDAEHHEVMRRIYNVNELVYAEKDEVANLEKLFKGLGKNVLVLPNKTVIDIEGKFTFWIRKDIEVIVQSHPSMTELIVWEDVGFSYELE